jgi:hypothetical protein
MVKRFFLLLLGMVLWPSAFLTPQTPADSPELRQRVKALYQIEFNDDFFLIAQEAGTLIWEGYQGPFPTKELWRHTLETALNASDKIGQILPRAGNSDMFAQAVDRSALVLIHILVSGDANAGIVQIQYTFRGVFSGSHQFEKGFETNVPQQDDLVAHFWLPVRVDLDAFLETAVIRPPVRIEGPAGTVVYGFSENPLTIPEAEYIFVDVPVPGTYAWKMVHKRYVNRKGIFLADREHLVLTLPRDKFSFSDFLRIFDGNNKTPQ